MFDLYVYALNLQNGQELDELPGLLVAAPPKRTARGRENDLLMVYLTLKGSGSIPPDDLQRLLGQLAEKYYQMGGTVTAGMRLAADLLNDYLLTRNLRGVKDNWQAEGGLGLAVLRRDTLYITRLGQVSAYVMVQKDVQVISDFDGSEHGLGIGRVISLRYTQVALQAGCLLFFSANPPASWTVQNLAGSPALSIDALRRRLLNQAPGQLQAAVFQFQPGKGQILRRRLRPGAASGAKPAAEAMDEQPAGKTETPARAATETLEAPETPAVVAAEPLVSEPAERAAAESPSEHSAEARVAPPAAQAGDRPRPTRPPRTHVDAPMLPTLEANHESAPAVRPARPPRERRLRPATSEQLKRSLAPAWRGWSRFTARAGQSAGTLVQRTLPGTEVGAPAGISRGTMLFIAVLVPLLVVAAAMTVYLQSGRGEQYRAAYEQAVQFVLQAEQQTDPALARNLYSQAYTALDRADLYGVTEDSMALRNKVDEAFDRIENINRLTLTPAILSGGLPSSILVQRMVVADTDLYLLDANSGNIIRLYKTSNAYQYTIDPTFECGPNTLTSRKIGPLIDLAALPPGSRDNATVLGMDANGTLLYCGPDQKAAAVDLIIPDSGSAKLKRFVLNKSLLYVLDEGNWRVLRYLGDVEQNFSDEPILFFGSTPPPLNDVISMAVHEDELYMLRANGFLADCIFSLVTFTAKCTDPATFTDMRTGKSIQTQLVPATRFTQVTTTSILGPSVFLLDVASSSVYRYTMRLNLESIISFRAPPGEKLPEGAPTAFTVLSGQAIFLAYGNQVYSAPLQ